MEQDKICPFMSTADKKVNCLKEKCQVWFREDQERESPLMSANCAVTHLPMLVHEISNNTRLIKASMEESVAI